MVCERHRATGATAAAERRGTGSDAVTAPIVDEAKSLVVKDQLLALSRLAVRLAGANAVFS